jgi:type II secretory pathway component PulK
MHQRRFHRGSVYLTVLSVSMIVSVIGVGALLAVRQQRLASDMADDADSARVAARSGIDIARYLIASDAIGERHTRAALGRRSAFEIVRPEST